MRIHITSGECLNEILKAIYPLETFLPFNEAMIRGAHVSPLFSDAFFTERAGELGVSETEYRTKLRGFIELLDHLDNYREIVLWFGEEPFCRANISAVLGTLSRFGYRGTVLLRTVEETTGKILREEDMTGKTTLGTGSALPSF